MIVEKKDTGTEAADRSPYRIPGRMTRLFAHQGGKGGIELRILA